MDYLEGVAKKMGIHVLIGTLSKDNQASIKLSEKMKYEKVAHVKNVGENLEPSLDVVMYQKEI